MNNRLRTINKYLYKKKSSLRGGQNSRLFKFKHISSDKVMFTPKMCLVHLSENILPFKGISNKKGRNISPIKLRHTNVTLCINLIVTL